MPNPYAMPEWDDFRREVMEQHDHRCCRCHRSQSDGAVLQVHHLKYELHRKPWEYAHTNCETLCKGCHAEAHGKIPPSDGWEWLGEYDLGDRIGHCEYCNTEIRYQYLVVHPRWPALLVGSECCDHLTGTVAASTHQKRLASTASRCARFVDSPRWKGSPGAWRIRHKRMPIAIFTDSNGVGLEICAKRGKKRFASDGEAKEFVFEFVDSGKAEEWRARCRP